MSGNTKNIIIPSWPFTKEGLFKFTSLRHLWMLGSTYLFLSPAHSSLAVTWGTVYPLPRIEEGVKVVFPVSSQEQTPSVSRITSSILSRENMEHAACSWRRWKRKPQSCNTFDWGKIDAYALYTDSFYVANLQGITESKLHYLPLFDQKYWSSHFLTLSGWWRLTIYT